MTEKMRSIQEVADALNVSYSVIYRLLRRGEMQCHRVGKTARISQAQLDAYLNRDRASKAPPDPGGLDLGIRCPKCETVLVRHRSENMIDDLTTRYSADCRQCELRIMYQIVGFDAWDAEIDKVTTGPGGDTIGEDLGEALVDPEGADPVGEAIEEAAAEEEEAGADEAPLPQILSATPNPCPKCKGHPSGQFEQLKPGEHEATLYCRTCNPNREPGRGLLYPVIRARASTPDDAMNAAVAAWNQEVSLTPSPAAPQAPQAGAQGEEVPK
ncbi:MAG: helix-turn-helix domain-containing protein [Desulfuromonadales bacterium]|nr:helix-turn-helix domain-containing protein [Desulfuromonadales bacterium]